MTTHADKQAAAAAMLRTDLDDLRRRVAKLDAAHGVNAQESVVIATQARQEIHAILQSAYHLRQRIHERETPLTLYEKELLQSYEATALAVFHQKFIPHEVSMTVIENLRTAINDACRC